MCVIMLYVCVLMGSVCCVILCMNVICLSGEMCSDVLIYVFIMLGCLFLLLVMLVLL